ncbi:adenosylcobinamide-GDP ribazoletransferase [Octadecabacter ascidiaceicola]|uniref:Adenosylcobinamide-GDP ribazoletransferase n=1 Tax=Octadecabacter ascidiaceicola TaxID=1655543 RepID=A0A238K5Q9_9RHOB|nr:adenosylcobinamide-GDP ribazoletransferase [Octadecabacter ascidiaceicola]SMX37774.1 Cobalamin synthase [Octadecabacter ascidiaceicola]
MTQNNDKTAPLSLSDIAAALGLLSRLSIPVDTDRAMQRGALASWAYPIAGLALALIAGAVTQIALLLVLPATLAAALTLATLIIATGAMHEDGLADSADGLWGGWDKEHRLKIMKDSHIGTYGVLALALSLLLRWSAYTVIIDHGMLWPAILTSAMVSRAVMVPIMATLPHARTEGLSHSVGRPTMQTAYIALAIAAVASLVLVQFWAVWLVAACAISTLGCIAIAKSKIEGQTGDILGATQQLTEITALLTLAALLT